MNHKVVSFIKTSKTHNAELWLAEARFGFHHVKEKIDAFEKPIRILEVGCGSGILLSMLSEEFPQHDFRGIEPFGDGFSSLSGLNSLVRDLGVELDIIGYEDFEPSLKYDLIYCVNVFEHVADWSHFLNWACEKLNDGGVFFVLCPNYSFPYESHFRIPIIWNKQLTFNIFKRIISSFEEKNDAYGLWNSLNFVTKKDVKRFITLNKSRLGFQLIDEIQIIDHMLDRIIDDAEFRKRQAIIGNIALFIKKIGLFNAIKMFPNYLPYMKLSFRKHRINRG